MVPVRTSVAAPSSASSNSSTSNHISTTSSSNTTTYVPAPGAVRKPLQERIPVANQQDKISFQQQEKPHVIVKKEPGTGSKSSLLNVIRHIEYDHLRPVKSEPDLVKPERTAVKRPAEDSLLHEVMHKLERDDDAELAHLHEKEEEMKRPKREELLGWDDLDAEDEGDPLMVSEYVADIFNYMQTLEVMHACIVRTRVDINYSSN